MGKKSNACQIQLLSLGHFKGAPKKFKNDCILAWFCLKLGYLKCKSCYSRVHISSDTAFFKILKKPSIVQK